MKTITLHTAVNLDYYVISCGIPLFVLKDSGSHFKNKLAAFLFALQGLNRLTASSYHSGHKKMKETVQ